MSTSRSVQAFIAVGSNIDAAANLRKAVLAIDRLAKRQLTSSTFRTRPWGVGEQADFLNMVIGIRTAATPCCLLQQLQRIERELGRRRVVRNGRRTIDLDILIYDQLVVREPRLTVPHPGLTERDFMLVPLLEVASDLIHPGTGDQLHLFRGGVRYRQMVYRLP